VILAVLVGSALVDMHLLFPTPYKDVVLKLASTTFGLLWYAVEGSLIVGGLILLVARLRPIELGLRYHGILPALGFTAVLWVVLHGWLIAAQLLDGQPVALAEQWSTTPIHAAGTIVGHFFGTALYEEIVFRGFLLVQLSIKFRVFLGGRRRSALILALMVSQALFAIAHVPHLLRRETPAGDYPFYLIDLFCHGLVFALVYARSGNLLLSVGAHGLMNGPGLLIASPARTRSLIVVLVICWLVLATVLRWLRGRRESRGAGLLQKQPDTQPTTAGPE
jgi:membrane protease YdiL (CAAX protease family)